MPVAHSPLISTTPGTPIASWARFTPSRLRSTALKVARSPGSMRFPWSLLAHPTS